MRNHLGELRLRTGADTMFGVLMTVGWLVLPPLDDLRRRAELEEIRFDLAAIIGRADALLAEL